MSAVIPQTCVQRVAARLGNRASPQALQYVQQQLALGAQPGPGGGPQLRQTGQRVQRQLALVAAIQQRNAAINAARFQAVRAYVNGTWSGKEAEGLRAILTGSVEGRRGARSSVALEQQQLADQYLGGLVTELDRAGLRETFASGAIDREVAQALWQLNSQQPNLAGLAREAVDIAQVIHRYQELARTHANAAGAWIGKLDGYVTRQSHDVWKIDGAGRQAWIAHIDPLLDWPRIEAAEGPIPDKAAWLSEVYTNLASGTHIKAQGATNTTGFKGPANLAKQMSAERILHFRDADAWSNYNDAFGTGSLREAVFTGLRRAAQNTGLMRMLGTNPEAMFDRLVDQLGRDVRATGNDDALRKFSAATADQGWLRNRLDEVTGAINIAVNKPAARWSANVRAVQSMAKLGGAVLSSLPDLATYASELSFQGRGFLSGVAEALGAVGRGRPDVERRQILSSLGVFFDSMVGEITRVGSLDDSVGGSLSRGQRLFFKLNLLDWWTETLRASAGLSMSNHLALNRGRAFADLPPDLQRTLGLFDIQDADWQAIRGNVHTAADGTEFVVGDGLPDAIADKLRRYIHDRANTAVLQPDADTRAMLRRGTRPGTVTGELARFIAQFKSYGVGFTRQVAGREVYGRGAQAWGQGSVMGLAQLMVTSTLLGYAAMSAKDMAKGRTPRDPLRPATVGAAMVQGGGFGIYGDYLFGQVSRFGGTALETAAGPTLGTVADTINLWGKLRSGDAVAADALRLAVSNTPFLNLFYTRAALDYAFLYHVQEAINPGAMARLEDRLQRDQGQTFLVPPSEVVR